MLSDRDYMQPPSQRWSQAGQGSILKPLICANFIVFVLTGLGENHKLIGLLMLHSSYIKKFEIWRLGTYMFAHGGWTHILFNMWGLYIFGRPLEQRLGGVRFMNLYFVSGIVGGLVWLLANWHGRSPVIGASGAVFGVMMATAMTFPNQIIVLLFPPIPMRLKTFVAVYGGIEVFMALQRTDKIAHLAHLGGILGGFLYMRRLRRAGGVIGDLQDWWGRRRAQRRRQQFRVVDGGKGGERADDNDVADISVETDRILDKIGRSGMESLTPNERRVLDQARERLRGRH